MVVWLYSFMFLKKLKLSKHMCQLQWLHRAIFGGIIYVLPSSNSLHLFNYVLYTVYVRY